MRAAQYTLRRTATQRVEKVYMTLGRQYHQVWTPVSFFLENLV